MSCAPSNSVLTDVLISMMSLSANSTKLAELPTDVVGMMKLSSEIATASTTQRGAGQSRGHTAGCRKSATTVGGSLDHGAAGEGAFPAYRCGDGEPASSRGHGRGEGTLS